MEEKLYSINEIVKWYTKNVDTEISDDFLIHIINKGILKQKEISLYSLNDVNDFLLEKNDNEFIHDENGKFCLKNNRKKIIDKFPKKEIRKPKKFKIATLDGNKLKLIKLN
jgi:hypothetical protein